jgi:hypothetical protein
LTVPSLLDSVRLSDPRAIGPGQVQPSGAAAAVPGIEQWNWTRYTVEVGNAAITNVARFGQRWIATGALNGNPAAWYSDDLVNWERAEIADDLQLLIRLVSSLGPVYPVGDRLIAVGTPTAGPPVAFSSTDLGRTWHGSALEVSWGATDHLWESHGARVTAVVETQSGFVAVGSLPELEWAVYMPRTAVWTSVDGLSWQLIGEEPQHGSIGQGVISGARRALSSVYAFGTAEGQPVVWRTEDGVEWSAPKPIGTEDGSVAFLTDSVYERLSLLLAAGTIGRDEESGQGVIWSSDDGQRWTAELVLDAPSEVRRVWEFDEQTVLAVGRQDQVASLWVWTDQLHWLPVPLDAERSWVGAAGVSEMEDTLVVHGNLATLDSDGVEVASEAVVWVGRPPFMSQSPIPSAAPRAEGELVPVPTSPPNPSGVCHQALLEGILVSDSETGFAVESGEGRRTGVRWPNGYTAREGPDGLELLDGDGQVVAKEGDGVRLGGGSSGELFGSCGAPEVVPNTLTGTLMGDPNYEGGCTWVSDAEGRRWAVAWPEPYRPDLSGDDAVLYRGNSVVGREGDHVTVRGTLGANFSYCGISYDAVEVLDIRAAP